MDVFDHPWCALMAPDELMLSVTTVGSQLVCTLRFSLFQRVQVWPAHLGSEFILCCTNMETGSTGNQNLFGRDVQLARSECEACPF